MPVLPIYIDGSPVLRKKAQPVKHISNEVIQLIMDMFETMHKANGIGLAANQVGELRRIIVIDISEVEGMENTLPLTLINPEVIEQNDNCIMEEGCLSVPDIRGEVERAETIRIKYKDTKFQNVELEANGILSRVILHEIDHLDGILFTDHLSPEKREAHEEELKKIRRGEIEVDYPIVTAAGISL